MPVVYSYVTTMMHPSSLPLWPRTVEWIRANHGNWLVDEVEHYYYSWKAPSKGGPQLKSLPSVGLPAARKARLRRIEARNHRAQVAIARPYGPRAYRRRSPTGWRAKGCGSAPDRSSPGARRCS